jgi:hypothetical protein
MQRASASAVTRLWELPLGTIRAGTLGNAPIGGGGYFRLLLGLVLEQALRSLTGKDENVMLYFHPYEFTSTRLMLDPGALPNDAPGFVRAQACLALQSIGRGRLPGRARRALAVAPAVRAIDLVNILDAYNPWEDS